MKQRQIDQPKSGGEDATSSIPIAVFVGESFGLLSLRVARSPEMYMLLKGENMVRRLGSGFKDFLLSSRSLRK